jgi:hypothetical protein
MGYAGSCVCGFWPVEHDNKHGKADNCTVSLCWQCYVYINMLKLVGMDPPFSNVHKLKMRSLLNVCSATMCNDIVKI